MTDTLSKALANAQAKFKAVKKDRTAKIKSEKGSYEYKYADLGNVIDCVKEALSANGLSFTQTTKITERGFVLVTTLMYGAESITSEWPLPSVAKPQEMGSYLTYFRRYSLCAILGVAAEEDDDGNASQNTTTVKVEPPKNKFTLLTDDGEEVGFSKPTEYLAAIEKAFKSSVNPLGFWDGNSMEFQKWQTNAVKAGHAAAPEFNRVGKMIVDSLQGKAA